MPGLLRGMARTAVISGTATAVSNRVSRRQAENWAAESPQPAAGGGDDMAQLEKLGQLHEQGVLTDEEFAAKKQQILGV
jgi:hypothetical protein